jgi:HEAT repeat protein
MPEAGDQPAKPLRTWRPMILWSAGILAVLGVLWLGISMYAPIRQTQDIVRSCRISAPAPPPGPPPWYGRIENAGEHIRRLGGPSRAASRLALYLRWSMRLSPSDASERLPAVVLLGHCGKPAVPTLLKLMRESDKDKCLGGWELFYLETAILRASQDAVPEMITALGDPDDRIREVAVFALGKGEAVPELRLALAHPNGRIRSGAAQALAQMRSLAGEAVPELVRALDDSELPVRLAAANALAQIGSRDRTAAVPALIRMLARPDGEERSSAAFALGMFGAEGRAAVPELTRAVGDPVVWVRFRAADALGRIGAAARESVPALERALEDESEQVRTAAASALKQIRGEEAGK